MDNTTPCRRSAPTTSSSSHGKSVHLKSIISRLSFPFKKNFAADHLFLEIRSNLRTDVRCRDRGQFHLSNELIGTPSLWLTHSSLNKATLEGIQAGCSSSGSRKRRGRRKRGKRKRGRRGWLSYLMGSLSQGLRVHIRQLHNFNLES